ncbi:MAG TPA: flagellar hook-associated protein FlgL [Clostridia bacterium]|nr:flagellar hook-associated protein FlgL [Clostridia bacterium]
MRITSNMLIDNFLKNLNSNYLRMAKYQNKIVTAKQFVRASEDPVNAVRSLQVRTDTASIEQYLKNIGDASSWLSQSEAALLEISDLIARAYELAVDAANGSKTPVDRQLMAAEVTQLQRQLVQTANAHYAGRYLFGGYGTTEKPFEIAGDPGASTLLYRGADMATLAADDHSGKEIEYEVGFNIRMAVSFSGIAIFGVGEDNLYAVFDRFSAALMDGTDQETLSKTIDDLKEKQAGILSLVAEAGGKQNRLKMMQKRFENDYYNLYALRSRIEDADYEKAVMNYKAAEIIYQSALAAGASIIQASLLDFLK